MNLSSHGTCVLLVTPRELDTLLPHVDMFHQVRGLHPFLPLLRLEVMHKELEMIPKEARMRDDS